MLYNAHTHTHRERVRERPSSENVKMRVEMVEKDERKKRELLNNEKIP